MCATDTDNTSRRRSCVAGTRILSVIACVTALLMSVSITATSCFVPGSAPSGAAGLAAEFTELEHRLHASMGLIVSAVGANPQQLVLGEWSSGPAWSTIKVPLIIAALDAEHPPVITDSMRAAITESNNAAAESIWATLGDPVTAARKVEGVLSKYGDPTTVQWRKVRPEFTAFGQTIWSLTNQVRFTAGAVCDPANAAVFTLMGQVVTDQRWGLGLIPNSRFKGGWGPSLSKSYLVRQLGVLKMPTGLSAVAMATQPASGLFADGTAELTEASRWLTQHLAELPVGRCGHQ
jgi:hypothetical protein